MSSYVTATFCAVTGATFFVLGALVQQDISCRRIKAIMVTDPYVYQCRTHIFRALELFWGSTNMSVVDNKTAKNSGGENTPSAKTSFEQPDIGSVSLFEQFTLWGRTKANKIIAFMSFSAGHREGNLEKEMEHVAGIMKYGFPGMDEVRVYKNFVLSYDRRNRIAHWVCEHIKKDCLEHRDPKTLHKPNLYITDTSILPTFCATMRDYRNSDWVGGHLASPQNYKCDMVKFTEAYKFPNIVPINRGLKNHIWLRLENYVRELAFKFGSVYVYTGPLFMPQRISFRNWSVRYHVTGMNTVAVPTHFFKIIICDENVDGAAPLMEGFVVPNADVDKEMDLRSFLSDIRDIEHFAGLKFYDGQQRDQIDMVVHVPSMTDFEE
ncbi:endonuclease G, mitochondrial [Drosophila elegans]|uniref:endonuclease G, mitochondrial n=1 Tax=Drosophila elegans TaxID=30023 RepID=UPI0007E5D910|nr:endonuclease G, mitochondrial [Drosophila elegans]